MRRIVDAEMLVQGPSEIEFRGGLFHCVERYSDEFSIRKIYTPAIYAAALMVANAAWAEFEQKKGAEIVQFKTG